MLSTGKDLDIAGKAEENLKTFMKIASGEQEFKFASQQISEDLGKNILLDRRFLQNKISEADLICKEDKEKGKQHIIEHTELYNAQKSLNYAYSERKKLWEQGWDSKLGDEYRAGMTKSTLNTMSEQEEAKDHSV